MPKISITAVRDLETKITGIKLNCDLHKIHHEIMNENTTELSNTKELGAVSGTNCLTFTVTVLHEEKSGVHTQNHPKFLEICESNPKTSKYLLKLALKESSS